MKNLSSRLFAICFLIAGSLFFTQCSDDDPMTDHGESFMTAKVGLGDTATIDFVAKSVVLEQSGGDFWIEALDDQENRINFVIYDYDGIKTYVGGGSNTERTMAEIILADPEGTWTSEDSKRIIGLSVFQDNNAFVSGEFYFGAGEEGNEIVVTNGTYKFVK